MLLLLLLLKELAGSVSGRGESSGRSPDSMRFVLDFGSWAGSGRVRVGSGPGRGRVEVARGSIGRRRSDFVNERTGVRLHLFHLQ